MINSGYWIKDGIAETPISLLLIDLQVQVVFQNHSYTHTHTRKSITIFQVFIFIIYLTDEMILFSTSVHDRFAKLKMKKMKTASYLFSFHYYQKAIHIQLRVLIFTFAQSYVSVCTNKT